MLIGMFSFYLNLYQAFSLNTHIKMTLKLYKPYCCFVIITEEMF